jgi:hypothetical protein
MLVEVWLRYNGEQVELVTVHALAPRSSNEFDRKQAKVLMCFYLA